MTQPRKPTLPAHIIAAVEEVARIDYVGRAMAKRWNANLREGELRWLTGWRWLQRGGTSHQYHLKTITVAYIDAYERLIMAQVAKPRLVRSV